MNYCSNAIFPKIAYRKSGVGTPVLLIHGFPADSNLWRLISPELSGQASLIIPDLPGTGESVLHQSGVTIEQLADAMITILDHEGIEKAIVAGHSMGGYAAIAMAKKYPERILGLSMVHSTAAADDEAKKQVRQKSIALIKKGAKEAFIRQTVPNLFALLAKEQHPELVGAQIENGLKVPAESLIAFYTAMMLRPDNTKVLDNISCPVQWIMGEDDRIIPFQTVLQQSHLACVNFVSVYKECGHMSMLEFPARLSADLIEFINYCHN